MRLWLGTLRLRLRMSPELAWESIPEEDMAARSLKEVWLSVAAGPAPLPGVLLAARSFPPTTLWGEAGAPGLFGLPLNGWH